MDLNRATIIGRLTRDPELRTIPSGKSVASFSIATNRQWTDASGQKQKQVEYHNIVAWARTAEIASQYLKKGSQIYVEGHLQTREWTAQDGTKKNRTEIVCDNLIMLGTKPAGGESFGSAASTFSPASSFAPPSHKATDGHSNASEDKPQEVIEEEIKVEDIPF
ncbi:MAG: single-stranded DNA-binding protein [Patescibacteria group bacterium]